MRVDPIGLPILLQPQSIQISGLGHPSGSGLPLPGCPLPPPPPPNPVPKLLPNLAGAPAPLPSGWWVSVLSVLPESYQPGSGSEWPAALLASASYPCNFPGRFSKFLGRARFLAGPRRRREAERDARDPPPCPPPPLTDAR